METYFKCFTELASYMLRDAIAFRQRNYEFRDSCDCDDSSGVIAVNDKPHVCIYISNSLKNLVCLFLS